MDRWKQDEKLHSHMRFLATYSHNYSVHKTSVSPFKGCGPLTSLSSLSSALPWLHCQAGPPDSKTGNSGDKVQQHSSHSSWQKHVLCISILITMCVAFLVTLTNSLSRSSLREGRFMWVLSSKGYSPSW